MQKYRPGRIREEMPYGKWMPYKEYVKLPLEKRLIKLSKKQDERARELYEKHVIVDMDVNCIGDLLGAPGAGERAKSVGITCIKSVGITCMWDTFHPSLVTGGGTYWEAYLRELRKRKVTYEKEFGVTVAENADDVRRAKKEGKQTVLFEYEGDITTLLGDGLLQVPCEDFAELGGAEAKLAHDMSLERIDMFCKYGMRCSHISYHYQSYLSHGRLSRYRDVAGLSETGLEVVERMNKLGMIIDLYNCGSKSLLDALEASKHPCVISHSGARSLFPRNIARHTDEEIKALAQKGGVIGVCALNNTLSSDERQGIWNVLDHIDYIVDLVGVDHVGIGTDNTFDYQWDLPCYTWSLKKEGVGFPSEYFEGFQNPDEWPNVTRGLVNRGYSDQEIEKIVGGNALRVMDEVMK